MTREEEIAQRCEKATNDPLAINRAGAYRLLQQDVLDIVPYLLGRVKELERTVDGYGSMCEESERERDALRLEVEALKEWQKRAVNLISFHELCMCDCEGFKDPDCKVCELLAEVPNE